MNTTEQILTQLTDWIEKEPNIDPNTFDFLTQLRHTEEELMQIRKDNEKTNLWNLTLFWDLRDATVDRYVLKPLEKGIIDFLEKVHTDQFLYKKKNDPNRIEVVDIYYKYYFYNSFYLFADPSSSYYHWSKMDRLSTDLELDSDHTEKQLKQLLEYLGIEYEKTLEEENFYEIWSTYLDDAVSFWESKIVAMVEHHWKVVKKEKNSKLYGFIAEGTGISSTWDLDTGDDIEEVRFGVRKELESRGIKIRAEIEME